MQWNGGRLEAVVTSKMTPPQRRTGIVDDVERGGKNYIERFPWQTDTCIGNWHYDIETYRNDGYKSAATVIHTLCDVVSKNGNLMLSVPMRGDGTIDDKEERIVNDIAEWMGRYGEAIYASRPWKLNGEGPTRGNSGNFSEGGPKSAYTARDVRYVTRNGNLHALVMGWPEDNIARMTLLAQGNPTMPGQIQRVTLQGDNSPLPFKRTAEALEVTLPLGARHEIGIPLIISGKGVTA